MQQNYRWAVAQDAIDDLRVVTLDLPTIHAS